MTNPIQAQGLQAHRLWVYEATDEASFKDRARLLVRLVHEPGLRALLAQPNSLVHKTSSAYTLVPVSSVVWLYTWRMPFRGHTITDLFRLGQNNKNNEIKYIYGRATSKIRFQVARPASAGEGPARVQGRARPWPARRPGYFWTYFEMGWVWDHVGAAGLCWQPLRQNVGFSQMS